MSFIRKEIRDGVALLWMDQPGDKLNKLSMELLDEFEALLDELEEDEEVSGVVLISAKEDNFIAGADIEQFAEFDTPQKATRASRAGQEMLDRIADFPKPVVAAINGAALGGGLEVALACHYRIASDHPKTRLAAPEVKLGLLPGAGGTQRLPRLIGLQKALPLLLTGKNAYAKPARKRGLVDEVIHQHGLARAAVEAAREMARGKLKSRDKRSLGEKLLEGNPLGRSIIFNKAAERVEKETRGNYPAPPKILEVVQTGYDKGMREGLKAESKAFGELMQTSEAKQLIRLFFAMNSGKGRWKEDARQVRALGVLGAGLMGAGIAQVSADNGYGVLLKDIDQESVARGEKRIYDDLQSKIDKKALSEFERDRLMSRIHGATNYSGFERVELVIEAVFEDLDLKRKIVAEVEEAAGENTIFASNTSAIPISQIAEGAKRPHNILGMHYFSPVPKMPLLEIVEAEHTSREAVATAAQVGVDQGKTVIVVGDGPGFYTTRILSPMMNEALLMLKEGVAIQELDRAMKRWGFPVGPVTLMDEVGLDVGAHVSDTLSEAFKARGVEADQILHKLVEEGYKGKKNRRGFYLYPKRRKKGKKQVNTAIYKHLGGQRRKRAEDEEIQRRLSLVMINEAAHCLQEGILRSPEDGDIGAILGLGFPPFRGGPFRYVDNNGASNVVGQMKDLESSRGPRFTPADILEEHARNDKRFTE